VRVSHNKQTMMAESHSASNLDMLDTLETLKRNTVMNERLVQDENVKEKMNQSKSNTVIYHVGRITALIVFFAWYISNILAVLSISSKHATNLCHASHLWDYILVLVAAVGTEFLVRLSQENTNHKYWGTVLFISLGFTVWGAAELCSVSCVGELKHTLLYSMTFINVVASASIYFCIIMCGIIFT